MAILSTLRWSLGGFSSWLHGILRHRFLKGRRQQNAARLSASDGLDQTPCIAYTPDRSAEMSEDALRIRRTVANLPEEHRLVVELRFFAGATLDEIAAVSWLPVGDGEVATASRAEKVAANESYREPFHFGRGIGRRANHE